MDRVSEGGVCVRGVGRDGLDCTRLLELEGDEGRGRRIDILEDVYWLSARVCVHGLYDRGSHVCRCSGNGLGGGGDGNRGLCGEGLWLAAVVADWLISIVEL